MTNICGGSSATEVTQEIKDLVAHSTDQLNAKFGTNHKSFTVSYAESQVVAGTNYVVHLTSDDGHKYTARVHVPLSHTGEKPQVLHGAQGHVTSKDLAWA